MKKVHKWQFSEEELESLEENHCKWLKIKCGTNYTDNLEVIHENENVLITLNNIILPPCKNCWK